MVNCLMKKTRKPQRAQPRKATPPLLFRSTEGDRVILMVDESLAPTTAWLTTQSRQPIFLKLGPGLAITVESRRIAKRRFAQLRIEKFPSENVDSELALGPERLAA
jgi:hypothetical protein